HQNTTQALQRPLLDTPTFSQSERGPRPAPVRQRRVMILNPIQSLAQTREPLVDTATNVLHIKQICHPRERSQQLHVSQAPPDAAPRSEAEECKDAIGKFDARLADDFCVPTLRAEVKGFG